MAGYDRLSYILMAIISSQSKDSNTIKQRFKDWSAGWLAGDVKAVLALYADDPGSKQQLLS